MWKRLFTFEHSAQFLDTAAALVILNQSDALLNS